jgi:hypothetical protein
MKFLKRAMGKMKKRKPIMPRELPRKPKAKKDEMGRSSLMYGGMAKKKKMMGGGRVNYKHGGYASVQEMEKKCSSMAGMNTMKIEGEK